MSVTESTASREAALNGRLTYLGTGAKLKLYDVTDTLIAEVALQNPAGTVSGGALTLLASGVGTVVATGTPTRASVFNGSNNLAFSMSAGVAGSVGGNNPDCVLSDAVLYSGGLVTIVSASIV